MDNCKTLNDFDKGEIVMAKRLDHSISTTTGLAWADGWMNGQIDGMDTKMPR